MSPARVAKLGAEFGKLKRGKIGIGGELLKSPFALNLLHGFCQLLSVKARRIELDAHYAKVGHDFVKLGRTCEFRDGAKPFGGLLRRRADGTKPGTGGLPGGPELLKPLRGDPGGLRRPAEVRLDLLQGSVDGGKVASRFLRAVRAYFNAYRRRPACHCLPLFLLCLSVSLA